MKLRVLSYNIRFGGTGREEALAEVIRECAPDLVVLQEATDTRVVDRLAKAAGLPDWAAKPGYSLAYISKVPIENHGWHELPQLRRAFLEIRPAGTKLSVFGVHLSAIHSNWTERRRVRELRALLADLHQHAVTDHILTGDFNTLAPGELLDMRKLPNRLKLLAWVGGGRIKFRTIQLMLDGGYTDAYRKLHTDNGYTFPTWDPHVRLDFAFVPNRCDSRILSCKVMREAGPARHASDHFPLLTEIDSDC